MKSLILLLALASQWSYSTKVPDYIPDLLFTQVQEDWIHANYPYITFDPNRMLSKEDAKLVELLTWPKIKIREAALQYLKKRPRQDNMRLVCWGRHAEDGELKYLCEQLIKQMFYCQECKGSGHVPLGGTFNEEPTNEVKTCGECGGVGTYLKTEKWSNFKNDFVEEDRVIFPPRENNVP